MEEHSLSLPELFIETQRLLHRYHMIKHCKEENGFDPRQGQGRILALLKKTGDLTQKELAYLLNIRQQSLGELLRKLEQSGYVNRRPSPKDKRAMIVSLTESGKNLKFREFDFKEAFSCLNVAEQKNLKEYLRRISERLTELLGTEDNTPDFHTEGWDERLRGTDRRFGRDAFERRPEFFE